jgi:hypothetical protein
MTCHDHQKIVTAFTIGYFTSYLKEQIIGNKNSLDGFIHSVIVQSREEIGETILKMYESLFEVKYGNSFNKECIEEIKESIDLVIQAIMEKMQKEDDTFLELAFLSGSFLSVAGSINSSQFDKDKFEAICSELLTSLKLNVTWAEIKKLFADLTSETIDKKVNSRDELFVTIANSQSNYEQVFGFQSVLENISNRNTLASLAKISECIA